MIIPVGPAYSTRPFAETCQSHLRAGQMVLVCPGSCAGSLDFKLAAGLALDNDDTLAAETSTLPYAVRAVGPAKLRVFLKLKAGLLVAAQPASRTDEIVKALSDVYPLSAAQNVLQTALQNQTN